MSQQSDLEAEIDDRECRFFIQKGFSLIASQAQEHKVISLLFGKGLVSAISAGIGYFAVREISPGVTASDLHEATSTMNKIGLASIFTAVTSAARISLDIIVVPLVLKVSYNDKEDKDITKKALVYEAATLSSDCAMSTASLFFFMDSGASFAAGAIWHSKPAIPASNYLNIFWQNRIMEGLGFRKAFSKTNYQVFNETRQHAKNLGSKVLDVGLVIVDYTKLEALIAYDKTTNLTSNLVSSGKKALRYAVLSIAAR